jgi:predicted Holliday junction resolvase-like endonuclease
LRYIWYHLGRLGLNQFVGSLLDLLVVIDAHINQLTNQFRIKSDELRAKAKQVRHKSFEVLNKRTKSFRDALTERERLDKTHDTVEKEIQKIRRSIGKRVNVFLAKWDDAKSVSLREKLRCDLRTGSVVCTVWT